MNKVVLYCRPGFEKECAAEITDKAARLEVFGFARVKEDSGYVIFEGYQQDDGEKLVRDLPFSSLIFARQMFVVGELLRDLPPCYTGYSYSNNNSPFYMGIPRLKFPSDAPSRSTLKLEEAFHVFIPADEWDERLANGMYAVDLGACPGGWTYQLVKRNMWVSSVDNGPMAQSLMDTGQVTWLREDGFRYRPNRNNISWMVCDMVEKPAKVAALMAQWLVNGWCRETIFNLKLPMKKRYEEVSQNLAYIQAQLDEHGVNAQIQARQLYHDREEVTVHVRRLWAAVGGRRDER